MVTPGEGCPGHLISPYSSQNTKNLIAALHSTPSHQHHSWTDTDVKVELNLTNRAVDLVEEGYDAVFRVGELTDSGLIARPLSPYRLALCAAPGYVAAHEPILTPWDLRNHDCLGFAHTDLRKHWAFDGPNGRETVPVSSRFMADQGEPLLHMALAGLGVILQPLELVREPLEDGRLIALLSSYTVPTRPLHILYAPDRRVTPKLRSFIDFSVRAFGRSETLQNEASVNILPAL
ncbi:LysR substrate-binding domain-containing protein [Agrobacterium pusense]|uniref:LysR substrate-binding domain-containing protein n=1 Tax=Agrobacterium pusense TaxID=648995 RepID=UPI002FDCBA3F